MFWKNMVAFGEDCSQIIAAFSEEGFMIYFDNVVPDLFLTSTPTFNIDEEPLFIQQYPKLWNLCCYTPNAVESGNLLYTLLSIGKENYSPTLYRVKKYYQANVNRYKRIIKEDEIKKIILKAKVEGAETYYDTMDTNDINIDIDAQSKLLVQELERTRQLIFQHRKEMKENCSIYGDENKGNPLSFRQIKKLFKDKIDTYENALEELEIKKISLKYQAEEADLIFRETLTRSEKGLRDFGQELSLLRINEWINNEAINYISQEIELFQKQNKIINLLEEGFIYLLINGIRVRNNIFLLNHPWFVK